MPNGFEPLRVERDIAEEMANTLGRIGRKMTLEHKRAWEAMATWEACPEDAGARKKSLEETLSRALDEAERTRYFLIVQREAMGLRDHREVAKKFSLPELPGRPPAAGDPSSPRLSFFGGFLRGRRRKTSG